MRDITDSKVQKLYLKGDDERNTFQILENVVEIYSSPSSAFDYEPIITSNKIKVKPAVKYFWQYQYYLGKLICRHRFSPLIAYCITNNITSPAGDVTEVSMVRLRNAETGQKLLLKSFNGRVVSMAFAIRIDPILAVLDKSRFLHVFKISSDCLDSVDLNSETLLVLRPRDAGSSPSKHQTLTWCPWDSRSGPAVPLLLSEPAEPRRPIYDDPSMILATSCGSRVEILNIEAAVRLLSSEAALSSVAPEVEPGDGQKTSSVTRCWSRDQLIQLLAKETESEDGLVYAWMSDHTDAVTATALSRDASCIASAGLDGQVCIYCLKVGKQSQDTADQARDTDLDTFCQLTPLLVFSPHDGQPLHELLFTDACGLENDGKPTWSHLITGARFNRELRLWSCANWTCSQLVSFHNPPVCAQSGDEADTGSAGAPTQRPTLVVALDWSASLLVVSDITRRVFYLIEIGQVPATSSLAAQANGCADSGVELVRLTSISEFLLSTPCFLFAVGSSDRKLGVSSADGNLVSLEIHGIHTRHLLNSTIHFHLPCWERTVEPQLAGTDVEDDEVVSFEQPSSPDNNESLMGNQAISSTAADNVSPCWSQKSGPQSSDGEKSGRRCPDETGQLIGISPADMSSRGNSSDRDSSPAKSDVIMLARPAVDQLTSDAPQLTGETSLVRVFAEGSQAEDEEVEEKEASAQDEGKEPNNDLVDRLFFSDLEDPQPKQQQQREQETPGDVASSAVEAAYPASLSVGPLSLSEQTQRLDGGMQRGPGNWSTMSLCSSSSSASQTTAGAADEDDGKQGGLASEAEETLNLLTPAALSPVEAFVPGAGREPSSSSSGQVLTLLTQLVAHSKRRDEQVSFLIGELASTQRRLDQLVGTHVELARNMEYLKQRITDRADSLAGDNAVETVGGPLKQQTNASRQRNKSKAGQDQANTVGESAVTPGESAPPEWARQLLLQFRTQQGEYSTRFSALNTTLSSISRFTSEVEKAFGQARPESGTPAATAADANRLERVSELTVSLMTPVLQRQLKSALAANPLQKNLRDSILRPIQDCLACIPKNVAEAVIRAFDDGKFRQQLAMATSASLSPELATAYRNSLQQVFLPQLEKTVNKLFQELSGLFQAGTQQYLQQVCSRPQPLPDTGKLAKTITTQLLPPIQKSLKEAVVGAQSAGLPIAGNGDQQQQSQRQQQQQQRERTTQPAKSGKGGGVPPDWSKSSPSVASPLTDIVDSGVTRPPTPMAAAAVKQQQQLVLLQQQLLLPAQRSTTSSVVSSAGAVGSGGGASAEEQKSMNSSAIHSVRVAAQLSQGDLVEALEAALNSKNQAIVLDTCSRINPDQLFNSGKFQVPQNVLLSLIHQLSCGDLSDESDIKLRYIQDAVLNLDKSHKATREYGAKVGGLLVQRLEAFLTSLSSQSTAKSLTDSSIGLVHRARTLLRSAKYIMSLNA